MARNERSAGFCVFRQTEAGPEYLLLDYGRHWDFPKGHVEKGEDDLAAARRELREETGISDPRLVPGFQHAITYFFRDRRKGVIRKTVVFFLAETDAKPSEIVISHEHEGFEFLPFDAAIRRVTFPNARQILRLAHQALTGSTGAGRQPDTSGANASQSDAGRRQNSSSRAEQSAEIG